MDEVDYESFMDAVERMRKFQKAYFKDRRQSDLEVSKKMEGIVDSLIASRHQPDLPW